jgi:integrase
VRGKTEAVVIRKVRELERQRDSGTIRKVGQRWTVKAWLVHWVETIAAPSLRETTMVGYRAAVYKHLIPGVGAHRLEKLEPEHLERLYVKMISTGSAPGHRPSGAPDDQDRPQRGRAAGASHEESGAIGEGSPA